jgi:hypothetical protein
LRLNLYSLALSFKSIINAHAKHDDDVQIPMKSEEFAMIENPQTKGTKHMKLNFYIPQTSSTYVGGERNVHFIFRSNTMEVKRMKKKHYEKRHEYMIKHPLLETLTGFIEARKCKTLDTFTTKEVKS